MANGAFDISLFSTPEQLQAKQVAARRAEDMAGGQTSLQSAVGAFGRGLAGDISGVRPEDSPAVALARTRQEAMKGVGFKDREGLFAASQKLVEAGDYEGGLKIAQLGHSMKVPEAKSTDTFREKVVVEGKERVGLYNKDGGDLIRYLGEGEEKKDDKVFDKESQFRKEYQNKSKFYEKSVHGYDTIQASAKDPDAVGDLSLIFAFMKVLDPESVVRESEFAVAENTAAKLDWFRKSWEKVKSGERLLPEQRQRFVSRAEKMMTVHNKRQDQLRGQYTGLSERANVNPRNVIVGLSATGDATIPPIVFAPQEQEWIDATKLANPNATEEEIIALGRAKGRIGAK